MLILPRLELQAGVILQCLRQLPTFDRLQELVLDCSLQRAPLVLQIVSSWLKASPYLQKLRLRQPSCTDRCGEKLALWLYKRSEEYLHENLREVELYKFRGKCCERILIEYLLKTATALEKIKIYRNSRIYLGNGRWKKWPIFVTRKKLSRRIRKSISNIGLTKTQLLVF